MLGFLFDFPSCSILELEAAISTVFATFWSSNLSFSRVFATFWRSNGSCAWYYVTRVRVYFGLVLFLEGLVWGFFTVGLGLFMVG